MDTSPLWKQTNEEIAAHYDEQGGVEVGGSGTQTVLDHSQGSVAALPG
jgi:hypothetical protein